MIGVIRFLNCFSAMVGTVFYVFDAPWFGLDSGVWLVAAMGNALFFADLKGMS